MPQLSGLCSGPRFACAGTIPYDDRLAATAAMSAVRAGTVLILAVGGPPADEHSRGLRPEECHTRGVHSRFTDANLAPLRPPLRA